MKRTSEIQIRCKGTPAQYWTLKLMINGNVVTVHTSKTWSYILEIQRNWLNPMKPTFSQEWR